MSLNTRRSYVSQLKKINDNFINEINHGAFHIFNAKNGSGKTHYISSLSWEILSYYFNNKPCKNYENLLCLTGTAFDKFPKLDKYKNACEKENLSGNINNFLYFGYNVNGNISTLINPFRVLFNSIKIEDYTWDKRVKLICNLLNKIGFENKIKIEFRDGVNTKKVIQPNEYNNKNKLEFIKFISTHGNEIEITKDNIQTIINAIQNTISNTGNTKKVTEIGDIFFCKVMQNQNKEKWYSLYDLSSGEYTFIRAIFCLCLGLKNNSLLLYDEPENSLHPTWQVELIETIVNIIKEFQNEFNYTITTIIATHSPLITSNIYHENVYFAKQNSNNWKWEKNDNFLGWRANEVLKEQFDMYSSRAKQFIITFQSVLDDYVQQHYLDEEGKKEFQDKLKELKDLNIKLHQDDPLHDLYYTVINHKFSGD